MGFNVGMGNRVRFWVDDWVGVGVGPLSALFLSNKLSLVSGCYVGEGGKGVSWNASFRRSLCQSKETNFVSLLSALANAFVCRGMKPTFASGNLNLPRCSHPSHFLEFWKRRLLSTLLVRWCGWIWLLREWRLFAGW